MRSYVKCALGILFAIPQTGLEEAKKVFTEQRYLFVFSVAKKKYI